VTPPVTPPGAANRPPTVQALCDPCTVMVGASSTVTANASDPDGDPLTYLWKPAAGTLAAPTQRQTIWTAPMNDGTVPVTVTVDDGKGGTASDTVNIVVVKPAVKEYTFEDVNFDFDRNVLRPDSLERIGELATAMKENPKLSVEIEGHADSIGTSEYNLALGERRAKSTMNYLVSQGVQANRITIISYGEERPACTQKNEECWSKNRRAQFLVKPR
jgi:peptidoglycan-associated lipoprotein